MSNITLILNVNSKKTLVQCLKASKVFKAICVFFFFILQHKAERKKIYQNISLQSTYNVAFVQSVSSLPVAEAGCKASCLNKPDYRILQSVSPLIGNKKKQTKQIKNKISQIPHIFQITVSFTTKNFHGLNPLFFRQALTSENAINFFRLAIFCPISGRVPGCVGV